MKSGPSQPSGRAPKALAPAACVRARDAPNARAAPASGRATVDPLELDPARRHGDDRDGPDPSGSAEPFEPGGLGLEEAVGGICACLHDGVHPPSVPDLPRARRGLDSAVMSTVSVIIPCLDDAVFLSACLEALGRQSRRADEVIVVDNGSSDDSVAVAEAAGVRVIREPRRGIWAATAAGFDAATGDLLAPARHGLGASARLARAPRAADGG